MVLLNANVMGIDQGSVMLFSDWESGGAMWTGQGPRTVLRAVEFNGRFRRPPAVKVLIGMWDIDKSTNQRADITAEAVTDTGFRIAFHTWGDTRIARVRAEWFAIGEMLGDDLWDV